MLGVDVGGTFTDAVLVGGGRFFHAKVLTTRDQSEGVLAAARQALGRAGLAAAAVDYFSHGMTTATNALLERKGARTASVATAGFRDILEIGRQNRPRLYDLCPRRPEPLVPRSLRLTVRERVAPEGELEPLATAELERLVAELKEKNPEAVAVCLLFSFLDGTHERRLARLLRRELPEVHISISSEVLPEFREYERFSTTAVDAYLTPVVARYLEALGRRAREAALPEPVIMQSSGGVLPLGQAAASAAPLLLSGPAAGVVGSVFAAGRSGVEDLIAFDMGGTSTDVTLIRAGRADVAAGREIGGAPVGLPMVDIHTIGAGGGSIAWVDAGGALRVGPQSAGADPGPACYGRGGSQATVTDANLSLGYLGGRLGGEGGLELDAGAAQAAVDSLAEELGMEPEEAALGVRRVANAEMVKALRVISVERGHDPRGLVLAAFGGAGPMHGADLAAELGMRRVLVPASCGVLSALGMVVGDRRRDWSRTVLGAGGWDARLIGETFAGMEKKAAAEMPGAVFVYRADLRYQGQSHELTIDIRPPFGVELLTAGFEHEHERAYGYRAEGEAVELVNLRLTALAPLERPRISRSRAGAAAAAGRPAYFDGRWLTAQVWWRDGLAGARAAGPAVIEEDEATTVVPPGWEAFIDESDNLWLERLEPEHD
ncbi:MAG: hydantoinase/oxoprolinase family protein [Thermoleophilia bacterium]